MFTKLILFDTDETEEEFSTRLANNLESLILKEGPETVKIFFFVPREGSYAILKIPYAICCLTVLKVSHRLLFSDCRLHC